MSNDFTTRRALRAATRGSRRKGRMRLFAGGLSTETNSFSPIPTGYDDFRRMAPSEMLSHASSSSFREYDMVARKQSAHLALGSHCFATPGGPLPRSAYERLRDELLAELDAALPVDGVLLTLHGAMVCDGIDDCESDLVQRVRSLVGASAKIGVLLDLHCDLPQALLDTADVVITVKEYPHVDVGKCARRLAELVTATIEGHVAPTMATFDSLMVGLYPTVREPLRGFVDTVLSGAELQDGVLAASVGYGFPYLDAVYPGARSLVVTDGDRSQAEQVAEQIGRALYALRREATITPLPLDEALDQVLRRTTSRGPMVLADIADNPGGGAPSDSTFVLRALLERGVTSVGLGPLWDPIAVRFAFAAEMGARFNLRLGGKIGPESGDPLDLTVRVKGLARDLVQRWPQLDGYVEIPMGDAACLDVGGIDVIAVSHRDQAFGLELFTTFGIDPGEKRLLILKSANHFRAAFDAVAEDVLYVDAGGALPSDPRSIPYTRFDRKAYPWIDDPLG